MLALAAGRGGKAFAVASSDNTISVLDAATLEPVGAPNAVGTTMRALAFSADGTALVAGGSDGVARLWDVATRRDPVTLKGHRGAVSSWPFTPRADPS